MKTLGSLLLAGWLMSSLSIYALDVPKLPRVVMNPAQAFWEENHPLERVFQFNRDFDLDGREDVAFTDQMLCGVHGLCGLTIFLRRADGKYLEIQGMQANLSGSILLRCGKHGGSVATHWVYGSGGDGSIISYRGLGKIREEGIHTRDENGAGIRRLEKVFGKSAPKLAAASRLLSHEEFLQLARQLAIPTQPAVPTPPFAEPVPHL